MKNLTFILTLICWFFAAQTVMAQEPVANLEHGGTSKVFYGKSSFADAYNASVNGDQIYLSAGSFDSPASIAKGVKITGAGHFPIEGKQTQIISGLNIDYGADSLRLEGLFINGTISYNYQNYINYVKVIRCSFSQANFSSSTTASKNYCSIEECFISGAIYFGRGFNDGGNNFLLRNSIVKGFVYYILSNALIDGNIFLLNSAFNQVNNSIIQNNIFLCKSLSFTNTNTINKNIFISSDPTNVNKATNSTGIDQADIFVIQTSPDLSYLQDYHLKTPGTYIGTDGTQVGLYGGLSFKENGVPSNPFVVSKIISPTTDTNGNLQINITVKAQDN